MWLVTGRVALVTGILASCVITLNSYTVTDVKSLKSSLFENVNYDKTIRPVYNQSGPLQVDIGAGLTDIMSFEMTTGQLDATFRLKLMWTDEFLVWNQADYGGIASLEVPSHSIWTPDIKAVFKTSSVIAESVRILNTGQVVWILGMYYEMFCSIDISMYPFDTQACSLWFFTMSSSSEVNLVSSSRTMYNLSVRPNSEWELEETSSVVILLPKTDIDDVDSFLMINTMKLKRLPTFIIIHSILPEIALSILQFAVFFLPPESGERVSFSIALILSFTVFLTSLSSQIPHNSRRISYYSIFLIAENFSASLCVIMSVVSVRLSRLPPVKVPGCFKLVCIPSWDTVTTHSSSGELDGLEKMPDDTETDTETSLKPDRFIKVSDMVDMFGFFFLIAIYLVISIIIGFVWSTGE